MTIKILSLTLMAFLFVCATCATAQSVDNTSGWANVKTLDAGQRVIIKKKNGETVKGLISQTNDDSIILIAEKNNVTLMREDVQQINLARKSKALGLLGGIVGGVGAFALSAFLIPVADNSESVDALTTGVVIASTAGGAVVGNRIGNRWRKSRLVYQFR